MQKTSPILGIKQILESQNLKVHSHIDPVHIPGSFSFPDTYEHAKKSAQFIHSFLRYSRIPMTLMAIPIFDHVHRIIIKVTFSFPEYVLACNMSARLIHLFKD